MATAQAAMISVCEGCQVDDAKWFCEDCHENLCNRCKEIHLNFKKTKNDTIVPIGQVKQGSKKKAVPVLCEVHRTKVCDLYCLTCGKLICVQCFSQSHKAHDLISVESLTESKVSELDNIQQNYESKLSLYDQVLDSESRQHAQYLTHIDQLEVEVKRQNDKIVRQFDRLRDQQLSELSDLRKEEEKRYQTKRSNCQSQIEAIRKYAESVQKAKVSGNAVTMIEVAAESTQSHQALEDPAVSDLPRLEFQHEYDLQPRLFLQLQGRITVRDTEVERKKKTSSVPVSQREARAVSATRAKDMHTVKVKSNFQIKGKQGFVYGIIPTDKNMAWVVVQTEKHLTLIDVEGNTVKTSSELNSAVMCAVAYRGDILVKCKDTHCVMRLTKDGDTVSTFADVSPFFAYGLCVTGNQDVLVCLVSSLKIDSSLTSKVVRLDSQGKVIQEIQYRNQEPLFTAANFVASLPTGDVVVADYIGQNRSWRVVCVDNSGNMKYAWNGEENGRPINNTWVGRITHGDQKVYVTDMNNHCVHVLDSDGKAEQIILDKLGITCPCAIHIDNNRKVWIGCKSKIYVLELTINRKC